VLPLERLDDLRRSVAGDVKKHTDMPMPVGHVPGFLRVNQSLAPYLVSRRVLVLAQLLLGPHVRIDAHRLRQRARHPQRCFPR
jgi:hypothetical protein